MTLVLYVVLLRHFMKPPSLQSVFIYLMKECAVFTVITHHCITAHISIVSYARMSLFLYEHNLKVLLCECV